MGRRRLAMVLAIAAVIVAGQPPVHAADDTYYYYYALTLRQTPDVTTDAHASFLNRVTLSLETIAVTPQSMVWTLSLVNRDPSASGHFYFQIDDAYLVDEAGQRLGGGGPAEVRGEPVARVDFALTFQVPPSQEPPGEGSTYTLYVLATHEGDHDLVPHSGHVWEVTATLDPTRTRMPRP